MGFIMKLNRIFSILSIVLLLSMGNNLFSMEKKQVSSDEEFTRLEKVDFLTYKDVKVAPLCGHDGINYAKGGNRIVKVLGKKIIVYNIIDNKKKKQICSYNHTDSVYCVCLSQDGNYVALGLGSEVIIYDIKNNQKIFSYECKSDFECICFSQDGSCVALGLSGGETEVKVFDIKNNKEICSYKCENYVNCVCFSQDGKYVASGLLDGEVKVFDIKNNKQICSYNYTGPVYCVCLSQDKNYVVSGSKGGKVIVYDIKNKKQICSYRHNKDVEYVGFFQDSERLISVDYDGQVIIHRVSPNFYLDQKRYEAGKKLEKFEKPDQQERVKFIKSNFSIKFIDGTEVNVSKCFLNS